MLVTDDLRNGAAHGALTECPQCAPHAPVLPVNLEKTTAYANRELLCKFVMPLLQNKQVLLEASARGVDGRGAPDVLANRLTDLLSFRSPKTDVWVCVDQKPKLQDGCLICAQINTRTV